MASRTRKSHTYLNDAQAGRRWRPRLAVGTVVALWSVGVVAGLAKIGLPAQSPLMGLPFGLQASAAAFPGALTGQDLFEGSRRSAQSAKGGRLGAAADAEACQGCTRVASLEAPVRQGPRLSALLAPVAGALPLQSHSEARFDVIIEQAELSRDKLAAAIAEARAALSRDGAEADEPSPDRFGAAQPEIAALGPVPERFGPSADQDDAQMPLALALAEPSAVAAGALATSESVLALPDAEDNDDGLDPNAADGASGDDQMPDSVPLPSPRPRALDNRAAMPPAEDRRAPQPQPGDRLIAPPAPPRAPTTVIAPPAARQQPNSRVAIAKPDNPTPGVGQVFRNLFGAARPSSGVAIYDISAKTVYLPDGTRLEAHSGIGAMADNPRYVAQRMNGPTPPHTYNLSMRETRFHGVEALRLTPVDNQNRYGRTGLLAHSYLLRNGRAQSHGCVAFKDYSRFLSAFKQGKIKQLVVVPGRGGKDATRVAANGSDV